MSRPPVALERLDLTTQGQVRYRMKTPYRYGTTHIVLEPLDFIARLAYELEVEGTMHLDFTDDTIVLPILKWLGTTGRIGSGRIIEITNAVALQFFDAYLRGGPKPRYEGEFPELTVEMNSYARE